mmetsp:Transcript_40045/g.87446  ORF Transcript_40045/g.87446 Transcript_40045/m.87446 type:complete len:1126 (+) Transcript_40045:88-3465(+)
MGLFDPCLGSSTTVPNFFLASGGSLLPLAAPAPSVPSPLDSGIQPSPGDDVTAPNSVSASRLNRIVCVSAAKVGYSSAAKDSILPSSLEYDATVGEGSGPGVFTLALRIVLEYESSFPQEGMVVWVKKHQQVVSDESTSQLVLVETAFEDYADGRWTPITTDIRYSEEAEAVVQAVITTDSGQTAGRVQTEGAVEDAKLGPVGERGRIVLHYFCEQLYSYAEMGLGSSAASRSLVPISFQLPWAALDNPASHCSLRTTVHAPRGTRQLHPQENILAYRDLQLSLASSQTAEARSQGVVLPEARETPECEFYRESLPPLPMMVLAWLSIPDETDDWEHVDQVAPSASRVTLMRPCTADEELLRASLPGGMAGHLVRCKVEASSGRRPDTIRVHTDITISDASGSTGMRAKGNETVTVRSLFNQHEERRVLTRLEAIPKLRSAGLLLDGDLWRQHFIVFHHEVKHEVHIQTAIRDLDDVTVEQLLKAISGDTVAVNALVQMNKQALLQDWSKFLETLRAVGPGGTTSFVAGAQGAQKSYERAKAGEFFSAQPNFEYTTYVNFDTDGGNNCGPCYDACRQLVEQADVVQGHVLGVGSWVDQDCASKVAKILKGVASLALTFPENVAADLLFRQDLSRWIKVLRTTPVRLSVSAGAVTWRARHGERSENGADCLFAAGDGLSFDPPDVSEADYTKAVLRGLKAGESATLYLLSRHPVQDLVWRLAVEVGGQRATVSIGTETLSGVVLGHHWLEAFGRVAKEGLAVNTSSLSSRLKHRLEDDLSFAWNIPSISGSTAALGRTKTKQRPPVTKEKQPDEPTLASLLPARTASGGFRCSPGGLFGAPAPAAFQSFGGGLLSSPPAAAAVGGFGGGFGGGCRFGASMASAAMPFAGRGQGDKKASAAAAAPAAPPPSGCFGSSAPSQGVSAPLSRRRRPPANDALSFGEPQANESGPSGPSALLAVSGFMRWGYPESPQEAAVRSIGALRTLAQLAMSVTAAAPVKEDTMVTTLLGQGPSGLSGTQPATHIGYTCDVSNVDPIVGVRFKATSTVNFDITEDCRRAGSYGGASGFRPIKEAGEAMRWALAAALAWWPLLWKDPVPAGPAQGLENVSTEGLSHAIFNLPQVVSVA